jgi:hypothetical protein
VLDEGYQGVEINFPDDPTFISEFMVELAAIRSHRDPNFILIAQQVLAQRNETFEAYAQRLEERLHVLIGLKPNAINSHTGKDYFEFEANVKLIQLAEKMSSASGIPIWHEIHRGRFSFHLRTLLRYLELFPKLNLVADFSHFCVVSESNLADQQDLLQQLYPNIRHIHARIGFEQSPQIIDPFAPEWELYLKQYTYWWRAILEQHRAENKDFLTITPECGPFPYMLQEPHTQKPLADQWGLNLRMKNYLQVYL